MGDRNGVGSPASTEGIRRAWSRTSGLLPSSYSFKHQTCKQRIFNGGESLQQCPGGFDDDEQRQRGF
ncbi:hypothetical protein HanRHA438_Chr10g0477281 [Helianthus annuus]|nr:hypothetical protein HanRHA438_Chr10g0477281 [Helianthus annuus]